VEGEKGCREEERNGEKLIDGVIQDEVRCRNDDCSVC
jgi:hypothetical protein